MGITVYSLSIMGNAGCVSSTVVHETLICAGRQSQDCLRFRLHCLYCLPHGHGGAMWVMLAGE